MAANKPAESEFILREKNTITATNWHLLLLSQFATATYFTPPIKSA